MPRAFGVLAFAILLAASHVPVLAQQGGTTYYVYDDNGRLSAVVSPAGEAALYEYDAAGNFTVIRRIGPETLTLLYFFPQEGPVGELVTFVGVGFGAGVNAVSFNGANARIVQVTPAAVIAEVPIGATTGLVTINTPRGSVTTAKPFTIISGVRVIPNPATVLLGQNLQFTALVTQLADQRVSWSVNSINSGSAEFGTISSTGLYSAPNRALSSVTIRATSVAAPTLFGESQLRVRDPDEVQGLVTASVSVNYGTPSIRASAGSAPLSVRRGLISGSVAATVSVRYGSRSGFGSATSTQVSVRRGSGPVAPTPLVSVRYGLNSISSAGISVTMGPVISTISPNQMTKGTTVTLTINGKNLDGATALSFITNANVIDPSIVASNVTANANGTLLTATVSIGSSTTLGQRVVMVTASGGRSLSANIGSNTIQVQ